MSMRVSRLILLSSALLLPMSVQAKTLKVWVVGWTGDGLKWLNDVVVKEFEGANPKTKVALTTNVFWQTRKERLAVAMAAGAAPDVITVGNGQAAIEGLEGLYLQLDSYIKNWPEAQHVNNRLWDTMQTQGKTYALPVTCDTRGILANGLILAKAGIEARDALSSWESLIDVCKKTTVLDSTSRKVIQAGYTTTWKDYVSQDYFLFLASAGVSVTDKNMRKPTFNSPLGVEAAEMMKTLYESSFPVGYKPLVQSDAELFSQGKAAMTRGLTWHMAATKARSQALAKQVHLYPVAYTTKTPAVIMAYVNGFAIPKGSKEPKLAFEFLKSLSSPKNLFRLNEFIGGCSPNTESIPIARSNNSAMLPWYEQLIKAKTAPVFPEIPETWTAIDESLNKLMSGQLGVKQTLDQCSATWQKGLDRWWSVGLRKKAMAAIGK